MRTHSAAFRAAVHPSNPHWTQLRKERALRQGGRCAVCGGVLGDRFEAHHTNYDRLGRETIFDIRVVHPGFPCHWLADVWRRQAGRFARWFWRFAR